MYSNEKNLILDCFAGSGTTGVSCIETDRRAFLIEKDENYFQIAEKRIKKSLRQQKLDQYFKKEKKEETMIS